MTFGDGGSQFYPLVDVNVSAHEVSHGFTEQHSDLVYLGQSGAMNEAFSDMAGEAAEYYQRGTVDWLVGSEIMKTQEALRYFEDPTKDGVSLDHSSQITILTDPHHGSGIYNKVFYTLANKPGWDVKKAFRVFAYANANYWTPMAHLGSGARDVESSAKDLGYSEQDVRDITASFDVVGLGSFTWMLVLAAFGAGLRRIRV